MRARGLFVLLGAILLGMSYQRAGLRRDRRRVPRRGRLVSIGAHRLHVVCAGAGGPPVIFESAIAGSSLSWAVVQPRVAAITRACAYDRAGLGWSDARPAATSLEAIVADLGAVIEHAAADERCVLVGHSFGAFVVQAYAARFPQRIAGLVLVDPAVEWLAPTSERRRMLRGGRGLARVGAVLAHAGVVRLCLSLVAGGVPGGPRRFVRVFGATAARTLERLVGEVRKLPPEVHPVVQAIWCQPKCFDALAAHMEAFERALPTIAAIDVPRDVPTVVISSAAQAPEVMAAQQRIVTGRPGSRHVMAERGAHWVQLDQPELVVEAVRLLVEQERPATA